MFIPFIKYNTYDIIFLEPLYIGDNGHSISFVDNDGVIHAKSLSSFSVPNQFLSNYDTFEIYQA